MLLEIKQWDVRGKPWPQPGLDVSFQVHPVDRTYDPYLLAIRSLYPRVQLVTRQVREDAHVRIVDAGPELIRPGQHFYVRLLIETPFELLERVERGRIDTGEVTIDLTLGLTTDSYTESYVGNARNRQGMSLSGASYLLSVANRVNAGQIGGREHRIARDEWLERLSELRFRQVLVMELPRRHVGADEDKFGKAYKLLESARRALDDHRYANVCGDVCTALEHLAPPNQKHKIWTEVVEAFFDGEMKNRVRDMLVGLAPMLHVGRHAGRDQPSRDVVVTREHAAFVLGTGTLIIGWCASLSTTARDARA